MKKALHIEKAEHGGYIVFVGRFHPGVAADPLFAGDIDNCLSFIRDFMDGDYDSK